LRGKVARQNPTDGSFRIFNPAIGQHDIADRGHVLMSRENHATDRGLDACTIYKIIFLIISRRLRCLPLKSRSVILVVSANSMWELRMSQVKRDMGRIEGLHYQAIEVALQAKALRECSFPGHSDWVLDQGDDEATRLAYTIGTNRWKNGEIDGEREEFLDAIKHAIKGAPYDCPQCDRMMAKD